MHRIIEGKNQVFVSICVNRNNVLNGFVLIEIYCILIYDLIRIEIKKVQPFSFDLL